MSQCIHIGQIRVSRLQLVVKHEWGVLNTIIIIIIEGLSLLQSIPPTTADKQAQAQKRRGSRSRKLLKN